MRRWSEGTAEGHYQIRAGGNANVVLSKNKDMQPLCLSPALMYITLSSEAMAAAVELSVPKPLDFQHSQDPLTHLLDLPTAWTLVPS